MGQNLATAHEALQVYESFEENSEVVHLRTTTDLRFSSSIHTQVIALYQQADKLLSSGQRGADICKSESHRLISEWQHFLNHLDKSSQLLILDVSFYNAARQFGLLLNEFEAYIEDLNEQVLHHQSTRDTDAQLAECNRQMQKLASQTDARVCRSDGAILGASFASLDRTGHAAGERRRFESREGFSGTATAARSDLGIA